VHALAAVGSSGIVASRCGLAMGDDDRNCKRQLKVGSIEPASNESAIIVNYTIEESVINEYGDLTVVGRKDSKKKIRVPIAEHSNIQRLAEQVVAKCKLINESKQPQVEKVLAVLQQRQIEEDHRGDGDERMARRGVSDKYLDQQQEHGAQFFGYYAKGQHQEQAAEMEAMQTASLEDVDNYIEKLYDSMEDKIKGTYMVLQLARNPDNLEVLVLNETLLGALSRILREDSVKSMDLCINIVYIFYSFSNFSQFHPVILQYHVGDMIMRVIELEIKRHALRTEDLQKKEARVSQGEGDMDEFEKEKKKMRVVTKKQEKLLYVCFHVLLNLAEDVAIERKMKNRKIVYFLITMLERKNAEVRMLVITFLKKLSIFRENKNEMSELHIVDKLSSMVSNSGDQILTAILQLLLNLSFDQDLREKMVKSGLIPKLVELLKRPMFQQVVLKLLYHLSMDDKCKSMFTYTDCIPMVTQMLIHYPEPLVAAEVAALAINLTANGRNAKLMCENDGLRALLSRVLRTYDPLLMKVIRNIAQHDDPYNMIFSEVAQELVIVAKKTDSTDLLVEILGTLANLSNAEIPFAQILLDYDFLNFLQQHLQPGFSEDDIVLEVVIFIGTCANDPKCSPILATSRLIQALYDLMTDKQEDDEIVLQISYTFYKLLEHKETRIQLLNSTQVVAYMLDLLHDKNQEIRKMSDTTLDFIMDCDEEWAKKIRQHKFQMHNVEWCQIVDQDLGDFNSYDAGMYGIEDDDGDDGFGNVAWVDSHDPNNRAMYWNEGDMMYDGDSGDDYM
jgi:hypothetical protein